MLDSRYIRTKLEPQIMDARLKQAISDTEHEIRSLKRPLEALTTAAVNLMDCGGCEDEVEKADLYTREVLTELQALEYRKKILQDIREEVHHSNVSNANASVDVHGKFCQRFTAELQRWDGLSTRLKYGNQPQYKEFREAIWEASGNEEPMPNIKTFLPGEAINGEESSDEELEIAGGTQNYKCPLCLKYLNSPLMSDVCQHAICQACFEGYLQQCSTSAVICPISGCEEHLTASMMKPAEGLGNRVRQARRRQENRQVEDEEEVIRPSGTSGAPIQLDGDTDAKVSTGRSKNGSQKKKVLVIDSEDDDEI